MSARLGPGNLLYDHGLPLRKLAMDRAVPAGDGVPWSSLSPGQQRLLGRMPLQWETLSAADQEVYARESQRLLNTSPQLRVALDAIAVNEREQLAKLIPNYNRL